MLIPVLLRCLASCAAPFQRSAIVLLGLATLPLYAEPILGGSAPAADQLPIKVELDATGVEIRATAPLPTILRTLGDAATVAVTLPRRDADPTPTKVSIRRRSVGAAFEHLLDGASYTLTWKNFSAKGEPRLQAVQVLQWAPSATPQGTAPPSEVRSSEVLSSEDIARIQARARAATADAPWELPSHIPELHEILGSSVEDAVHQALRRGGLVLPDARGGQDMRP